MPAQLLVYGDPEVGEVELGICVEGDLRATHGLELAAVDAVARLGISVAKPDPRPTLTPELEQQRVSREQVEIIKLAPSIPEQRNSSDGTHQRRVDDIPVRSVSVFEHPELLTKAINSARRRLLIISPWVRGGVVNANFVGALERRIRAGVDVHIGHGIGSDDSQSDEWALQKLSNLAARYKDKFHLVRLMNTHAKILIFDGIWINTSFNWLSFQGDPNRTFRMEEGTLVQIPSEVDKAFAQYVAVLESGGADPRNPRD
jgi:phosphatidylserine/phosphatidylglycerophosphate/cardiolipin synthase-like enzyme